MNILRQQPKHFLAVTLASLLLVACAQTPAPEGAAEVRNKLTELQANQELAARAPVAIKDAEAAVRAAELPESDKDLADHRVLMADRRVDIATARARERLYEDQRQGLDKASQSARLDARTREADRARLDADLAREDASLARGDAEAARQSEEELKRQLAELNAKETARGIVITLGDVLFATGRAELTGGAPEGLRKLAAFVGQYPDRNIAIEGHTDNVGSESSNFNLSRRRADTVQSFLANLGVPADRMRTAGMGEGSPVAGNDTPSGRQQNRRVEVIVETDRQTSR